MKQRLFLQKTPPEKREENPKLPYFRLVMPPEEDGGEWTEVAALWVAKSGKGYSGTVLDGIEIKKVVYPREDAPIEPTRAPAQPYNAPQEPNQVPAQPNMNHGSQPQQTYQSDNTTDGSW